MTQTEGLQSPQVTIGEDKLYHNLLMQSVTKKVYEDVQRIIPNVPRLSPLRRALCHVTTLATNHSRRSNARG